MLHITPLISSNIISMLAHSATEHLINQSLPISSIHDFSITETNSGKVVTLGWETHPTTPKTATLIMGVGYQRQSSKGDICDVISLRMNIASFKIVENGLQLTEKKEENDITESLFEHMKGDVQQETFTQDVSGNTVLYYNSQVTANNILEAVTVLSSFK